MKEFTVSAPPSRPGPAGSKSQPTKQDSAAFGNVLLKDVDPAIITIDPVQITKDVRKIVDRVDAENKKKREARDPEAGWRDELQQLETKLRGAWTAKEAQEHADSVERTQNDIVATIERDIKKCRKVLESPFLSIVNTHAVACGCDKCVIERKIASLEYTLAAAVKEREKQIRLSGATVASCRELDKLRPRLNELRKRAAEIDAVVEQIKGLPGDGQFHHEGPMTGSRPTPVGLTYEK